MKTVGFWAFIVTQFLGAFNDNAFKFLIIGFAMSRLSETASRNYVPMASAMFILPFLVFAGFAGYLSDRFSKKRVMVWTKILEIAIMVTGWVFFRQQLEYWLLVVLFVMGAQSTLFSPAKYGFMPETLPEQQLSSGNGIVQLFTFLAIIAGGATGPFLAEHYKAHSEQASLFCIAVAVIGTLTSFAITRTREGDASVRPAFDPLMPSVRTLRHISTDHVLVYAIVGNTFFWLMATVFQSNIPIIVKQDLQLPDTQMGYLQAAIALGIGIGSAIAGGASRGKIAYHFVIPGGIAMALLLLVCGLCNGKFAMSLVGSAAVGIAAGFYQIPLTACIQQRCPENIRGACLAACNALDCVSMLLGTALHWLLLTPLKLSGGMVLVALSVITLAFMMVLWNKCPHELRKRA